MVDVSGFITFMEDYSKRNNREIEIQFNTDWNKDKGIYIYITNFDEDDEEQYLLNCKITEKGYHFSGVNKWNLEIIEEVLACIKYENRGMFPGDVYINGHDYDMTSSFESVKELLDYYNAWGDEDIIMMKKMKNKKGEKMNIKEEYVKNGLNFLNEMYKNFKNLALENNEIRKIINTKNDNPLSHFRFKVLIGPRKDLYTFPTREERDIAFKNPETLEEKIVVIGVGIHFKDKIVEFNSYKTYISDEDIRKEITGDNSIIRMAKCLLNAEVERKMQEPKYIRMKYIVDLMVEERGLKDLELKRS